MSLFRWNSNDIPFTIMNSTYHSSFHLFTTTQHRWNKNDEVLHILECARIHPEWISVRIEERPPSGTQLLFERKDGSYYKMDGYEWRKRKEGRLIREDHMKLKVNKLELISANYAHSAVVPTFHRRVYWLTSNPDIVLVHYLRSEGSEEGEDAQSSLSARIAASLRRNALNPNENQLLLQLIPILSSPSLSIDSLRLLTSQVLLLLNEHSRLTPESISEHSPNYRILLNNTDLLLQVPHKQRKYLNRRNSCSSASRRGLSSLILARQPSAFSDTIDGHFISEVDKNCGKEWRETTPLSSFNTDDVAHCGSHCGDTPPSSDEALPSEWTRPENGIGCCSEWSMGVTSQWSSTESNGSLHVCPNSSSIKGGERIVVVGGWYLRGHIYHVHFGDRRVKAKLLQVGVLEVTSPPSSSVGRVSLSVSADGIISSSPVYFYYKDDRGTQLLLQSLADRTQMVAVAFGLVVSLSSYDECTILRTLHALSHGNRSLLYPHLLSSPIPSRTLIHLAAALDAQPILEHLLFWRSALPSTREFDLNAKDGEGRTPLDVALAYRSRGAATVLATALGNVEEVQRATEKIRSESGMSMGQSMDREWEGEEGEETHARNTALWVMSDGERMIDNQQDNQMIRTQPLEISMDTEVQVPDSPTMANLFKAVTSPSAVDLYTREQMGQLARQLIEALPNGVKTREGYRSNGMMMGMYEREENRERNGNSLDHEMMSQHNHSVYMHSDSHHSQYGQFFGGYTPIGGDILNEPRMHFNEMQMNSECLQHNIPSLASLDIDFGERELGEFFSQYTQSDDIDPLQKKLENLKLKPSDLRQVYEAALVMQQSALGRGEEPPTEGEKEAARKIHNCYRQYKQFCYLRRLHDAAVVVQKHFRLRRKNQNEETHDEVQEHPSVQGESICIQVPNRSLTREHRAAATIQNAYRGHRKRQAAARLIQKFMRRRHKLRKFHEANDVVCTPLVFPQERQSDGTDTITYNSPLHS